MRVADQAALAAGGVAIHRSVLSVRFFVCLLPPCMRSLEHKPRHGGASSPNYAYPLGDILSRRPDRADPGESSSPLPQSEGEYDQGQANHHSEGTDKRR